MKRISKLLYAVFLLQILLTGCDIFNENYPKNENEAIAPKHTNLIKGELTSLIGFDKSSVEIEKRI